MYKITALSTKLHSRDKLFVKSIIKVIAVLTKHVKNMMLSVCGRGYCYKYFGDATPKIDII